MKADVYTRVGLVTKPMNSLSFHDNQSKRVSNYYDNGILKFMSGPNSNRDFHSYTPMDRLLHVGDQYEVIAGCDKSFDACINKFNNHENFRGEPHL